MRTKYDVAYERSDCMPEDSNSLLTGRALTQEEVRIREHIFDVVRDAMEERIGPLRARADEIREDDRTVTHRDDSPVQRLYDTHEEYTQLQDSVALKGIKMGYLVGQREGLRLGIGLMLRVLTTQDSAGNLETRAPGTADLLAILRAMADDKAADALILKEMGASPDKDE